VEYIFICGLKADISSDEFDCYEVLGPMEACMHACPDPQIRGNLHNCPSFLDYYNGV